MSNRNPPRITTGVVVTLTGKGGMPCAHREFRFFFEGGAPRGYASAANALRAWERQEARKEAVAAG